MNRNDMRSVVYLIIALICFYYLMDDFLGKNKITNWVTKFVGDFGGTAMPDPVADPSMAPADQPAPAAAPATAKPAAAPAKDTGSIKIPAPEIDTGKIKIPQPQGKPATKSGSGGFSLNDLAGSWSWGDLFNPLHSPLTLLPAAVAAETVALPEQLKHAFGG
jgi:hypothetical protein